jgi:predicted PurR-regulated permease PerM
MEYMTGKTTYQIILIFIKPFLIHCSKMGKPTVFAITMCSFLALSAYLLFTIYPQHDSVVNVNRLVSQHITPSQWTPQNLQNAMNALDRAMQTGNLTAINNALQKLNQNFMQNPMPPVRSPVQNQGTMV